MDFCLLRMMKPFALSVVEGLVTKPVVRQAHHERGCFTLEP
jgi:hypothetical protein